MNTNTPPTLLDRLLPLVSNQFGVRADVLTPEWHFARDGNADLLDTVELVLAIEDEFQITLDDTDCETRATIGDVVQLIAETIKPV